MRSRDNAIYLDDFLTLDNNMSTMLFDPQEIYELGSIHEVEEYRLERFVRDEAVRSVLGPLSEEHYGYPTDSRCIGGLVPMGPYT